VAQECQRVFTGTTYHPDADGGGVPRFGYHKADRRVTAYYFYLVDEVFGPAFIKVCAYFLRTQDVGLDFFHCALALRSLYVLSVLEVANCYQHVLA
jgi:hypothetical protein